MVEMGTMETNTEKSGQAAEYQKIRRRLTLFHLILTPALLGILIASGWTFGMRQNAVALAGVNDWGVVAVYFVLFSLFSILLLARFHLFENKKPLLIVLAVFIFAAHHALR